MDFFTNLFSDCCKPSPCEKSNVIVESPIENHIEDDTTNNIDDDEVKVCLNEKESNNKLKDNFLDNKSKCFSDKSKKFNESIIGINDKDHNKHKNSSINQSRNNFKLDDIELKYDLVSLSYNSFNLKNMPYDPSYLNLEYTPKKKIMKEKK